jgi:amino-acid N-acetyltransferase
MINQLSSKHKSQVIDILKMHQLPVEDIDLGKQHFFGYFKNDTLLGIGALEINNNSALVRSLAVSKEIQNTGIGSKLLYHLITETKRLNLKDLFLLTETADKFFSQHGFVTINRKDVPKHISVTEEFKNLCPDSAICMALKLTS